ncbi:unnamed protein product [Adineta steineri]|uniref:Dishevelled-like protein n=1 Tax=Adineta steineri TaxID=433720 RepID=A0A813T3Z5_9BILA|nr:unnamed protein product [Adineta steineri]CAF3700523.1 unnamed protein product [Adineta steineri]
MSDDAGNLPVEQTSPSPPSPQLPPSSSTPTNSEIKIFYYIDDQDPPYLTKLNLSSSPRLKDFKNALDRNCTKYKFFFATNDPSIGKVKEEITNDEQILPFDTTDRILAYLVSIEGSTTSSGGGGGGSKQSKYHHHHDRDDTIATSTTSSSFAIQQPRLQRTSRRYASGNSADHEKYFKPHSQQQQQQRVINDDIASFPSSDLESTTFLDETEDDRYSTVTDSTAVSSRYHGRNRPRRPKKHRLPPGFDRTSSFSSLNSESTMTLNIITVTLNLDAVNFLGISIVGQSDRTGGSDGGIYIGSIMKGGAVAQDGRIEPGDMILQVNDISFEGLSNDDAVKILRETVQKPGPIKLVVAKCWDPTPRGYFTLPRHEQARPVDPLSWLAHTQAVQNTYNNPQHHLLLHHPPNHRQSLINSTANVNSTISTTSNTMTDHERFGLDLNLTVNSDMDTIVRAMAEPDSGLDIRDRIWLKIPIPKSFLGSDLVNWLFEYVDGFVNRNDARKYASSMLKAGYIRHTVHKLTFSEQCYYIFGDFYAQGISQLTLDEEAEDYETVSDQTSTEHRSGDSSLTTLRQNTVTTFGFVDKNNAPLQSPSHSLFSDTHNSVMLMKTSPCRHLSCMDPAIICSNNHDNDITTSSSPVEMFSTPKSLQRRTGPFGVKRLEYLKQLLNEYEHTSTNNEHKLQLLANFANFSYDPINYIYLRQLNIIDLFLDCLQMHTDDDFVHYALAGLCNMSADKINNQLILEKNPTILICLIKYLFSNRFDIVINSMLTLMFLCDYNEQIKNELIQRIEIRQCLEKYSQSKDIRLSNMAKLFLQDYFS